MNEPRGREEYWEEITDRDPNLLKATCAVRREAVFLSEGEIMEDAKRRMARTMGETMMEMGLIQFKSFDFPYPEGSKEKPSIHLTAKAAVLNLQAYQEMKKKAYLYDSLLTRTYLLRRSPEENEE